jgi:hypothetical protein
MTGKTSTVRIRGRDGSKGTAVVQETVEGAEGAYPWGWRWLVRGETLLSGVLQTRWHADEHGVYRPCANRWGEPKTSCAWCAAWTGDERVDWLRAYRALA